MREEGGGREGGRRWEGGKDGRRDLGREIKRKRGREEKLNMSGSDPQKNICADNLFSLFFATSQVVIAGVLAEGATHVEALVKGAGIAGPITFRVDRLHVAPATLLEEDNFIARLWAYLAVQVMSGD